MLKKLIAMTTVVIGVMAAAHPASAVVDWWWEPDYIPQDVRVIDTMWINPDHLQQWYAGRNAAFAEWDFPFSIEDGGPPTYPWTDENVNSGLAIQNIVPDAIVIIRNRSSVCSNMGAWDESLQGGIVVLCPWAPWWQQQTAISQVVAHEAGHALGLGHAGNGVMGGAIHVNDEERAAVRAFYEAEGFVWS